MSPSDTRRESNASRVAKYLLVVVVVASLIAAPILGARRNADPYAHRVAAAAAAPKANWSRSANDTNLWFVSRVNRAAAGGGYPRDGPGVKATNHPSHCQDGAQTSGAAAAGLRLGLCEALAAFVVMVVLAWELLFVG